MGGEDVRQARSTGLPPPPRLNRNGGGDAHNHGSGPTRQSPAEGSTGVTPEETNETKEQPSRTPVPLPRPVSLAFASVFVLGMLYSIATDGDPKVIIALGGFALLALGVDLGSLWGRK